MGKTHKRGETMNITQEMLKEQVENVNKNLEGYKQGYLMALSWIASVIATEEPKKDETVKAND